MAFDDKSARVSRSNAAIKGGGADDGEDEDGGGDLDEAQWNLRKCAASSLDQLGTTFGEEILPHLLPG